jgi:hypothetical protein
MDIDKNKFDDKEEEEEKENLDNSLTIADKFDPKFRKDMETIKSMGYDEKMIRKVYIFLKPNELNEALDYLSSEDGIYNHDFMEMHGHKSKCFICGQPPKNHINYQPENQRTSIIESIRDSVGHTGKNINHNLADLNKKESEDNALLGEPLLDLNNKKPRTKPANPVECDLCMEEMYEDEIIGNKLNCNHLYCNTCYLNYFQEKIVNNKVGKITCMQFKCPSEFDDNFIISHLAGDEKLIQKYKKFKLRNQLYSDENVKFCPVKNCESYARKEGENKYVTCLEGHQFCFQCSKPWHGNKKCQDEIDKDFKKWKKNKLIKKCPKCKFWTEKNNGCNHMTCPECKHEWCWLCGAKCDVGHFKMGGGCYGLQFTQKKCYNNCIFLYLYKLMIFLFQVLMLIFYIPSLMLVYGFSFNENIFIEKYPKPLYYMTCGLFVLIFFFLFAGLGSIFCFISLFVCCLKRKAITFLLDLAGY